MNSTYVAAPDLTAVATVYDMNMNKIFEDKATVQLKPDGALSAIAIPEKIFAAGVSFVDLTLKNKAGAVVSRNFYWVPAKASTYDWTRGGDNTPILTYEDMTALKKLPQAKIDASVQIVGRKAKIHLHNASSALAFQIAVTTNADEGERKTGEKVSPVLWSDNYVELTAGRVFDAERYSAAEDEGHAGVPHNGLEHCGENSEAGNGGGRQIITVLLEVHPAARHNSIRVHSLTARVCKRRTRICKRSCRFQPGRSLPADRLPAKP